MKSLAVISGGLAAGWLAIILLLHVIKPALDPRTRMISEYARGRGGWIMQIAFFCLAASCWALAAAIRTLLPPVGPILLSFCGIGCAGAGIFVTDPVLSQEPVQTRSGTLHLAFAFGTMLLFPIMATFIGNGLTHVSAFANCWFPIVVLPWTGLLVFAATGILAARNPQSPVGYAERFLVVNFTVWQIWAALTVFQIA